MGKNGGRKPRVTIRDVQMCARFIQGANYSQIGREFNLNHTRVREIAIRDKWDVRHQEMIADAYGGVDHTCKDITTRLVDVLDEGVRRFEKAFYKRKKGMTGSEMGDVRLTLQFLENRNRLNDGKPTVNVSQSGGKQVFIMPEGMKLPGVFDIDPEKTEIQYIKPGAMKPTITLDHIKEVMHTEETGEEEKESSDEDA